VEGKTLMLSAGGDDPWRGVFTDLPAYDEDGIAIVYGVQETAVPNYETTVVWDADKNCFIITNTRRHDICLEKQDSINPETKLANAAFELYLEDSSGQPIPGADGETGTPVNGWGGSNRYTTNADGQVWFESLLPGTYWLYEAETPAGYFLPGQAFCFQLKDDGSIVGISGTAMMDVVQINVGGEGRLVLVIKNSPVYELPATGGTGGSAFSAIGLALMCLTGGLLFRKRERRDECR